MSDSVHTPGAAALRTGTLKSSKSLDLLGGSKQHCAWSMEGTPYLSESPLPSARPRHLPLWASVSSAGW